jgi:hypothetical protein
MPRSFSEKEIYTCAGGHSVDGKAAGDKAFTLDCLANGDYSEHDGCKPVECGSVEVAAHSKLVEVNTPAKALLQQSAMGRQSDMKFPQRAVFECLPGYSLDGRLGGATEFTKRCQANGTITHHAGCVNMDDCEGNVCGPNGKCVDKPNPTGNHFNDYECSCDSGFKAGVKDNMHICVNIPDCPENACEPGSCHDLVNDYKCTCPTGYSEDANSAEGLAHDCMPHECGKPKEVRHASTKVTKSVFFNSPPVEYSCDEGYTLDGAAKGDTTFEITCQADHSFTQPSECIPVGCGQTIPGER